MGNRLRLASIRVMRVLTIFGVWSQVHAGGPSAEKTWAIWTLNTKSILTML